jgi:hypothetical protein
MACRRRRAIPGKAFAALVLATALLGGVSFAGDETAHQLVRSVLAGPGNAGAAHVRPGILLAQSSASAQSPLKRRDLPPPTIRPQLVSRDPAGDDEIDCEVGAPRRGPGEPIPATPSDCIAEITDTLSLSYTGFPTSGDLGHLISPISVTLMLPDGSTRRYLINEQTQTLYLEPGMPLGVYRFTGMGAGRSAAGGFTLKPAGKRVLRVALPSPYERTIQPGGLVTVHLAGYPALQTQTLYLYRYFSHRDVDSGLTYWQFATRLTSLTTNVRGEAAYSFATQPGDPLGQYLIVDDPLQQNDLNSATFELAVPGFKMPSNNIFCRIGPPVGNASVGDLRCDILQVTHKPAPPRDCPLSWGDAFAISQNGTMGLRICHGDTIQDDALMPLAYGSQWNEGGFLCKSATTGVTCTNAAGHGFRLSREVQTLF